MPISRDLRNIADTLEAKRKFAVSFPFGGSLFANTSLGEVDHLIVALREIADRVAILESLPAVEPPAVVRLPVGENVVPLRRNKP